MIEFSRHSGIYTLYSKQIIPISLDQAWNFFSSPDNLKLITPGHMGFYIASELRSGKMYPGQIISYKVSPFGGIKTNWVTEITHVAEKEYFVDEQRFGPYKMWHHEHIFKTSSEGTEMEDIISYKLPLSPLSDIFHNILIKPKLMEIFTFREQKIIDIFQK